MRTIMKVSVPVESGNQAIRDGKLGGIIESTLQSLKAEAAYFYAEGGKRHALIVFDLKEPSDIPVAAERLFQELNAEITMSPCMNAADVKAGLAKIAAGV